MTSEFRIGDKVRVVVADRYNTGYVGIIAAAPETGRWRYDVVIEDRKSEGLWPYNDDELELVEPALVVGDRVRVVKAKHFVGEARNGAEGIVKSTTLEHRYGSIGVVLTKTATGDDPDGFTYIYAVSELERISEEPAKPVEEARPATPAFKVGDRVKVAGACSKYAWYKDYADKTGVVTEIGYFGVSARFEGIGVGLFRLDELEPAPLSYKVGDRVRVRRNYNISHLPGASLETTGTVYSVGGLLYVRFDDTKGYDRVPAVTILEVLAPEPPKAKFNVGDRVKVVKLGDGMSTIHLGMVGVIDEYGSAGRFPYHVQGEHHALWFGDDELELAPAETKPTFKVGDRVVAKATDYFASEASAGARGIVVEKPTNDFVGRTVGVRLTKDANGRLLDDAFAYAYRPEDLELDTTPAWKKPEGYAHTSDERINEMAGSLKTDGVLLDVKGDAAVTRNGDRIFVLRLENVRDVE